MISCAVDALPRMFSISFSKDRKCSTTHVFLCKNNKGYINIIITITMMITSIVIISSTFIAMFISAQSIGSIWMWVSTNGQITHKSLHRDTWGTKYQSLFPINPYRAAFCIFYNKFLHQISTPNFQTKFLNQISTPHFYNCHVKRIWLRGSGYI